MFAHRTAIIVLACAAFAPAQTLSGSFTSNPVQVGQSVQLTVTDSTGLGFMLNGSSCFGLTIYAGSPSGPAVLQPTVCTEDLVLIAPYGSWVVNWDQLDGNGVQVPPGTYYLSAVANGTTNFFPVTIQASVAEPTLVQTSAARVNQALTMDLSAPALPGALYVTAFSLSTNVGIDLGSMFVSLDPDPMLALSLTAPAGFFTNTQGTLDGLGSAPGIAVHIPNVPSLAHLGLAAQAFVFDPQGPSASLTNPLVFSIAP